jgi:DNA primase
MARIPDAEIERIKQVVSLQRLAEALGVILKRHGADLIGLCPFHDDHEPSLVITPKENLWHCLGACQAGGSVIDWVMKAEGVSFRHAVELLQADYQPLAAGSVKHSTVQKLPTALESDADDARLLAQVVDYYHESLKQSPEALAYLEKRGIASSEAIERFRLGFANRTLGYRLPAKNRKEGAAIRGQLQRIGLLRASGHEHFNGSIVIPVFDEQRQVTEIYGRKINDNLREGTPKHLYLPGPHKGVWNIDALKASSEIILCESLIDALTFWCAGFRNVTASYGVEGFTADHLAAFKQYNTERVLIAYDRDAAGKAAAEKLSKQLTAEGLDCYRLNFPKGMDANEYALQVKPAGKSLGVVIRSAQWLSNGKPKPLTTVPESGEQIDTDTGEVFTVSEPLAPLVADPLPATIVPPAPANEIPADVKDHEVQIAFGNRRYRIRGLEKNLGYAALKVNLLAARNDAVHVDTLDLYSAKARSAFIKQAAVELGVEDNVIKADFGKVLLKCEALQDERIRAAQAPKQTTVALSDEEQRAALELLKSPDLLEQIQTDFGRCGVVGEATNKQIAYLAAISRKLDTPLAVTIQSTSAAGKSSLMDAVLAFIPEEERIKYSAMTGQSLFYMGEANLKHKVLAIVEEEGASNAAYALKLLQSEGELTIASTGKDPVTGKLETQEYRVEGPVMIMLTTTAIDVDEELLNRCIVLSVDEGRQQTQAIHALQRDKRTLEGLLAKADRQSIQRLHQNAQRLLQPLAVVNPYARHLTFVDDRTRTRRDHEKYLTLIDSLALLHQHQRSIKTVNHNGQPIRYVEVTLDDIETANRLAHEVLGRTLDELPPQTRRLLHLLHEMIIERCASLAMARADYRFSRRDIREHTGWSDFQVKTHMRKLESMEYVLVHRGGRGQSFVYELLYAGEGIDGDAFLMGLIDIAHLKSYGYDNNKEHPKSHKEGSKSPQSAPKEPRRCSGKNTDKTNADNDLTHIDNTDTGKRTSKGKNNGKSYRSHSSGLAAKGVAS